MRVDKSFAHVSVVFKLLHTIRRGHSHSFHLLPEKTSRLMAGVLTSAPLEQQRGRSPPQLPAERRGAMCLLARRARGLRQRDGGLPVWFVFKGERWAENVLRGRGAERDKLSVFCFGFHLPGTRPGRGRGRLASRGVAGTV